MAENIFTTHITSTKDLLVSNTYKFFTPIYVAPMIKPIGFVREIGSSLSDKVFWHSNRLTGNQCEFISNPCIPCICIQYYADCANYHNVSLMLLLFQMFWTLTLLPLPFLSFFISLCCSSCHDCVLDTCIHVHANKLYGVFYFDAFQL